MSQSLVVIGAGPGGYVAAIRGTQLGARVTLVEEAQVGGTCLNWGCIPTKALKATADALALAGQMAELGVVLPGPAALDLAQAQARKAKVVADQAKGIEALLKAHGVELARGRGRLLAPGRVAVTGTDGVMRELAAEGVILATGSAPADLPGLTRDGKLVLNSDDALALTELPRRLAVVGGGVVGCEFAFILAAFGCEVTVIEALDRLLPLPSLEPEISRTLLREAKKRKIKTQLGMVVNELLPGPEGVTLRLTPSPLVDHGPRPPKPAEIVADRVLVSVGRRPRVAGLGFAELGGALDGRGAVRAGSDLATSLPGVFAIGDLLGTARPMLAHVASAEGVVAAANALGGRESLDYAVVPAAAFTSPEVAWVGLSAAQAAARGIAARVDAFPFRLLGKAQAMGEIAGVALLVSETGGGRLLGAHLLGPHASDLVHECALALKLGATVADLAHTIHAHPTLSEAVSQAAEAALGLCPHLPPVKPSA